MQLKLTKEQWERLQKAPEYHREFIMYDIMAAHGLDIGKQPKKPIEVQQTELF